MTILINNTVYSAFCRLYNASDICTVGFEPNPEHESALAKLEKAYNKCGFRVKIFTKTAVGEYDGGKFSNFAKRWLY